jgi:transposase InsO family protein
LSAEADGADLPPMSSKNEAAVPLVDHMNIMQAHTQQQSVGGAQAERRALERQVRLRALELVDCLAEIGIGLEQAAARLGIGARTLRHWDLMSRQQNDASALLGRPRADSGAAQQQAVVDHLKANGAGVSVPALRVQFPDMARSELDRLVKGYRDQWREHNRRWLHVLHWQRPGTVWAMDFAESPALIDGIYPYLLAVRDLASGKQLLWKPVMAESADVVITELAPLFLAYGAPWVLKSDNGPAFRAEPTKHFLTRWEVFALFSPPYTPSYNGAIEAAIGSLKTRTQQLALLDGQPDLWTSGLVEAARRQANETARPRRLHVLTPDEVWDGRQRLTADERAAFRASVGQYQADARQEKGLVGEGQDHWSQAAIDRVAIRRACVTHDLLWFRRRSIPGQIKRQKAATRG